MCGIVGSVGFKDTRKYLIEGLKILDYRGYDSAGIALLENKNKIDIFRAVGSVEQLDSIIPNGVAGKLGIGHTRWATHGKPSEANAHPHLSNDENFAIVHNGVIENFIEIKNRLLRSGYTFYSGTDTEVVANLLQDNYAKYLNLQKALRQTMKELEGSFAIVIITKYDPDALYCLKNSSPLLIGEADGFNLVASDATPMIEYTNKFIELEDYELARVTKEKIQIFDSHLDEIQHKYVIKEPDSCKKNLNGYPHFMLKEIEECETVIRRLMVTYCDNGVFNFDDDLIERIQESDHIVFIACGTSYHASLFGERYFEHIGKPSSCYIASEWAFYPKMPGKKPFFILISQSGETADVIHCMKILQENSMPTLIITNTKGSTLERGCTYSLLLNAGLEVSVASTKAYVAQVTMLALLTNALQNRHKIVRDLEQCCHIVSEIRTTCKEKIQEMARELKDKTHIFYLGRGYDYDLSLEASLKLKEISYIYSEAFPGGELKHGPIALIEPGVSVIVFITDDVTAKSMRANVQEIKARGASVYVISVKSLSEPDDYIVVNDYPRYLSSAAISTIAFYFAYYVSLFKGLNVDKPRNLAKSVTVE